MKLGGSVSPLGVEQKKTRQPELGLDIDVNVSNESSYRDDMIYTPYPMILSPYASNGKQDETQYIPETPSLRRENIYDYNHKENKDATPFSSLIFRTKDVALEESESSSELLQSWSDSQANRYNSFISARKNIDAIGYCMVLSEDNVSWSSCEFLLRWCCNLYTESLWMKELFKEVSRTSVDTVEHVKTLSNNSINKICYTLLQRINRVFSVRGDIGVLINIKNQNAESTEEGINCNNDINISSSAVSSRKWQRENTATLKNCSLLHSAIVHNSPIIVSMLLKFQLLEEQRMYINSPVSSSTKKKERADGESKENNYSTTTSKSETPTIICAHECSTPFTASRCYISEKHFMKLCKANNRHDTEGGKETSARQQNLLKTRKIRDTVYIVLGCLQLSVLLGSTEICTVLFDYIHKNSMIVRSKSNFSRDLLECNEIAMMTGDIKMLKFISELIGADAAHN